MCRFQAEFRGAKLLFETDSRLFSPKGPDRGTMAMLNSITLNPGMRVLDLGCGYGLVGLLVAAVIGAEGVVMSDVSPLAVEVARRNARLNSLDGVELLVSDGFKSIPHTGFDLILSNPPYHEDFSVPKTFIEKGFNRLAIGGYLYMVTRRRQWYKKRFISVFGGVRVHNVEGYYVFEGEKRSQAYSSRGG